MLDVHPPEHAIHGTRDFFIHLLTITAGLLIALALEAGVEALHHHHQRQEAQRLILAEIRANKDDLSKAGPQATTELKNLQKLLAFAEARSQGQAGDPSGIDIAFHEGPMDDSAWRTAASTGAIAFLDYTQVQRFAAVYKEQDLLQATEEKALDDYLQMQTVLNAPGTTPKALSKEAAAAALPYIRQAIAHVTGMLDIGAGLWEACGEALK